MAVLLICRGDVRAAPSSPAGVLSVEVSPPTCKEEPFPMVPFLDSLRVELAGRGLTCCTLVDPGISSVGAEALRVSVELLPCAPEATLIQIGVADSRQVRVEHDVSLSDVEEAARARALALAAAELIRSFGQMPATEPTRETPVVAQEPAVSATPAERPMSSRLSLGVEGQVRVVPTRSTTLWGGRMLLTLPWRVLYMQFDLGGDATFARSELGTISLATVSMGLGVGPRFAGRTLILDLGPRLALGWAWIRGRTDATDVRTGSGGGMVATLGARAALQTPAGARLRPGIALEGGGVLAGTRGESDGRTVVGITGYYLIGTFTVAISL